MARSVPREPNGACAVFNISRAVKYPGRHPVYSDPSMFLHETSALISLSSGLRPICLPNQQQATAATAGLTPLVVGGTLDRSDGGWRRTGKTEVI